MSDQVVAVVPAAGRGVRMGGSTPKQFLSLGGIPLLVHSLRTLSSIQAITEIIVVIPEADLAYCQDEVIYRYDLEKVTQVVPGGKRRQDSVRLGVNAINEPPELVLVHDGVRPFITREIIEQSIQVARDTGCALVAIPMKDTVKRVDTQGRVKATLNREELWSAQTPQVFRYSWLLEAHQMAETQQLDVTDDAGLIEQLGHPVTVVPGSVQNIKITKPEDLLLGESILSNRQTQGRLSE